MTKRDYELIAEAIRTFSLGNDRDARKVGAVREDLALHFSGPLANTNPHFDVDRFLRACTGKDDKPHATERRKASLKAGKARVQRALGRPVDGPPVTRVRVGRQLGEPTGRNG